MGGVVRYLILTTFWAAILPGILFSIPILFLFMQPNWIGGCIAVLQLVFCCFLLFGCRFILYYHQEARKGKLPTSFLVCVLPFFLPLFYCQLLASISFIAASKAQQCVDPFFLWGLPQYFTWNLFYWLSVSFGRGFHTENALFIPLFSSIVVAFGGSVYVWWIAPLAKFRTSSLVCLISITFILGIIMICSWKNYRELTCPNLDGRCFPIILFERRNYVCKKTTKTQRFTKDLFGNSKIVIPAQAGI